jgi:predicted ArsR family transcriptional regulator
MLGHSELRIVPKERDTDTGQFEEVYDEDRICEILKGTRLSTSEVAEELNCHRTTAHRKLTELKDNGTLSSTQVGNTLLWELA